MRLIFALSLLALLAVIAAAAGEESKESNTDMLQGVNGGELTQAREKRAAGKEDKGAKKKRARKRRKNKAKRRSGKAKRQKKQKSRAARKKKRKGKKASLKKRKRGGNGRKNNRQKKRRRNKSRKASKKRGKNKRKAKKGDKTRKRKGKGKGKRKGKGKGKGKRKGKDRKKNRNQRKRFKKKSRSNGINTRQCSDSCTRSLASIAKMQGIQLRNLERQLVQIKKNEERIMGKKDKMKVFNENLALFESTVGNDSASAKCKGSSLDTNQTDDLKMLKGCEKMVETECSYTMNSSAEFNKCNTTLMSVMSKINQITDANKPVSEICSMAESLTNGTEIKDIQTCLDSTIKNLLKDSKSEWQKCSRGFIGCRQSERASIKHVFNCKGGSASLPGVNSPQEAQKQLDQLNELDGALEETEAKFGDAMEKAGLKEGPGADGTLPSGVNLPTLIRRSKRQADGCDAVLTEWTNFNKSAEAAASNKDSAFNAGESSKATDSLKKINSRPNLVDDLKSCDSGTSGNRQVIVSVRIIVIRFYVFWCIRWRLVVVQVKITIIVISFNIQTTPRPPITPVPTNAPGRRRRFLLNNYKTMFN